MKNTVLAYQQHGNKRTIQINNLKDMYAYIYAYKLKYLNGIVALQDIEGEFDKENFNVDILIEEEINEHGETLETFAYYEGDKIKLEGLDLC